MLPTPSVSTDSPRAARLLDEPRPQLGLRRGQGLAEVAAGRRRPPRPARGRATSRSKSSGMLAPMEFQDVVRRRRMVRNYSDDPVDPAVVDRALANATRAPNAGFSQGWAFLVLDTPEDVRRWWRTTADDVDRPRPLAGRDDARAGRDRAVLQQGGLPRAVRRARQGLDRPGRGPLADAVLAHGHRDGEPADPADRGRRGPRRAASSASRRSATPPSVAGSASRTTTTPSA